MRIIKSIIYTIVLALVIASCGTDKNHFKIDGQLMNINQGEFIVYSPDGAMATADTLKVRGGRFEFMGECLKEGTALIVMPNGTEVPVFVEPGASLSLKGDAQNLGQVEVTGTKANEAMNEFRKATNGKTGKQIIEPLTETVKKYPQEVTGLYLIRHYLLPLSAYEEASKVVDIMLEEQADNSSLAALKAQLKEMISSQVGKPLPFVSAKTVDDRDVTNKELSQGVTAIICWASWDVASTSLLRRLLTIKYADGTRPAILGISFDADVSKAKIQLAGEELDATFYNVCDGQMVDGHLAHSFSLSQVPTIIIANKGRIVERQLLGDQAVNKIQQLGGK